jgi:hypothetical protein
LLLYTVWASLLLP